MERELKEIFGNRYKTSPVELIVYERDAGIDTGKPDAVVYPENENEVKKLVQIAKEKNLKLVPRTSGTSLSGGPVPAQGGIVVKFSRMKEILSTDFFEKKTTVQPGVINLELNEYLSDNGYFFPPDPASQRASAIGGNVAENAGGPLCFKYGVTSHYVLGMNVVLPDGELYKLGGHAPDFPGYDLTGFFVGSEGTLGIFTEFILKFNKQQPSRGTLLAVFDDLGDAARGVSMIIARGLKPATLELMDRNMIRIVEDYVRIGLPTDADAILIIDVEGYEASIKPQADKLVQTLKEAGARNLKFAVDPEERAAIWFARKSAAGAISRLKPFHYIVDVVVPRSKLPVLIKKAREIVESYGLTSGTLAHAGDGNLHPEILLDLDEEQIKKAIEAARKIATLCVNEDGTITGEHGVGLEKKEYMNIMFTNDELRTMKSLKDTLDPQNIMNPGKIFPNTLNGRTRKFPDYVEKISHAVKNSVKIQPVGNSTRVKPFTENTIKVEEGIIEFLPEDLMLVVKAGTRIDEIKKFVKENNLYFPHSAPSEFSTIGGSIGLNQNSPESLKYGALRNRVLGMTIIRGDGTPLKFGAKVIKNVAGYDVPKLYFGSLGTLGVIADVILKLEPIPQVVKHFEFKSPDLDEFREVLKEIHQRSLLLSAMVLSKDGTYYRMNLTIEGHEKDFAEEIKILPNVLEETTFSPVEIWRERVFSRYKLGLALRAIFINLDTLLSAQDTIIDWGNQAVYTSAITERTKQMVEFGDGYIFSLQENLIYPEKRYLKLMKKIKTSLDPEAKFPNYPI